MKYIYIITIVFTIFVILGTMGFLPFQAITKILGFFIGISPFVLAICIFIILIYKLKGKLKYKPR